MIERTCNKKLKPGLASASVSEDSVRDGPDWYSNLDLSATKPVRNYIGHPARTMLIIDNAYNGKVH